MQKQGFGDLAAPPPALCEAATNAAHCWRFCDGWAPERWPAYEALHNVEDWAMQIELMQFLKERI